MGNTIFGGALVIITVKFHVNYYYEPFLADN